MTRKQYVVEVTSQLQADAKAVLAGHGLKPAYLNLIASRPDVCAKLAMMAYSSKAAKKGKNALKRGLNFKVCGYKSFTDFNFVARKDVEAFMSRLGASDAATFNNADNILTLVILADTATGELENDIVNGQSVVVSFAQSVLKDYKIPGGIYITMMFGSSYIAPREEANAGRKESINKRIAARRTPAKIRAELTAKAKSKLTAIKVTNSKLKGAASKPAAELQQFAQLGRAVGIEAFEDPKEVINAIKEYNSTNKALLKSLDSGDKALYVKAANLYKRGKIVQANRILAEIGIPALTALVRGGNKVSTDAIAAEKAKAYRAKIKEISGVNVKLLDKLEAAKTAREKANVRFAIKQNTNAIKAIKAKMSVHKDLKVTTIRNKAKVLAETNRMIEQNLAKGATIQQALQMALSKLPVDQQVKEQVRQDIVQQIAAGTPMQYAVQQSIQNVAGVAQQLEDEVDYQNYPMQETLANNFPQSKQQIADQQLADQQLLDDDFQSLDAVSSLPDATYSDEFDLDDDDFSDADLIDDSEFNDISSSLLGSKSVADILASL